MEAMDEDSSRRWNTPGLYTVAPGVYRIPLPLPPDTLGAVNVYAVTDGVGLVLIDSGWVLDGSRKLLADALRGLGAELGDVTRYLVTHVHRDHYTQAVALRREFGTPVALGEWEKESLAVSGDSSVPPMAAQVRLLRLAGAGRLADELAKDAEVARDDLDLWEPPDEWLVPGTRSVLPHRELRVVHTPGHTSGHVVFDDALAGLMFTGDHVLPHITPSLDYQPVPAKLPLRDYLHSLHLVRGIPDRMMLPAHGPVAPSVHARVDELLAHHGDRLSQVGDAVRDGCTTAFEAAERLLWTRESRRTSDLPTFHAVLAVLETAMHLDLLVAQGNLAACDIDGVRRYRPA
jgi:glyoxylase-like metal-dependent hydrolase (beta-lactamase superfamily II)